MGRFPCQSELPPTGTIPHLLAVAVVATGLACRPTADMLPEDVRTYTAPRTPEAPLSAAVAPAVPPTQRATALRYELPAGWIDVGASGMRLATLRTAADAADPADVGEITIIPASGTLHGNATRWQEQLTPTVDPEQVDRAIAAGEKVDVDGVEATVLMLLDDAEENQQAILAAVIPVDDTTSLFVKFKGAASLARRLHDPFTTFVRSIRWK